MIVSPTRMEYFSDGIIAIAITIMVLDIELTKFDGVTLENEWSMFATLIPRFLIYLLSFIMLGMMWINHHTLFHVVQCVDIKLLWHNLHLLFWLTLVPFATSAMGRLPMLPLPIAIYGAVMFMSSVAFTLCRKYAEGHHMIYEAHAKNLDERIRRCMVRMRTKSSTGLMFYLAGTLVAFLNQYAAYICFIVPAVIYLIPETIENKRIAMFLYNRLRKIHH